MNSVELSRIIINLLAVSNKPIVIYGAGRSGRVFFDFFKKHPGTKNMSISCFCDDGCENEDKNFLGVPLLPTAAAIRKYPDGIYIVAMSYPLGGYRQLTDMGINLFYPSSTIQNILLSVYPEYSNYHNFPREKSSLWVSELPFYKKKVYSSGEQDGYLEWIFANITPTNKKFVEFGFNSKDFTATTPNARLLFENGWSGVFFDSEYSNPEINLYKETLSSENIVDVFKKYDVPADLDYLSIDVDSIDLWLLDAALSGYRPKVVSVEFNSNVPVHRAITFAEDDTSAFFNNDKIYGASLKAMYLVARKHNYRLVGVADNVDAFFVAQEFIADQINLPELGDFTPSCSGDMHPFCTNGNEQYAIDYEVYTATGDSILAKKAAEDMHYCFTGKSDISYDALTGNYAREWK